MTPASVILADLWFWFGADRDRARGDDFQATRFRFIACIIPTCGRNGCAARCPQVSACNPGLGSHRLLGAYSGLQANSSQAL